MKLSGRPSGLRPGLPWAGDGSDYEPEGKAMRNLFLVLLLLPAAAQAQPETLAFETVHSEAVRPDLDFETVVADSEWFPTGGRPAHYRFGAGVTAGMVGSDALFIEARPRADSWPYQTGTLMQMMPSDPWLGKRIRLTARLKSENVRRAYLWLRVDGDTINGTAAHRSLAFNTGGPVGGTTDWKRYEIVLDVSDQSWRIAYGFVLSGVTGKAWADGFTIESVGTDVPVTPSSPP
jgi:hypothetical protein